MIRLTITLNTDLKPAEAAHRIMDAAAAWAGVMDIKAVPVRPVGRPQKYSDKVRTAARKMAAMGHAADYIGTKMHVGVGTVRKWIRE